MQILRRIQKKRGTGSRESADIALQLFVNNPLKANSIPAAEEETGAKDDGKLKYGIQGNAANESIWNLADDGKLESLEASKVRVQIKVDYKKIKRSKSNL